MARYIELDALVAEIERRVNFQNKDRDFNYLQIKELEALLSYLDTLEIKEVDLEKELVDYHNDNFSPCNDGTLLSNETGAELAWYDYERIAKHFFELGMLVSNKTKKGEKV